MVALRRLFHAEKAPSTPVSGNRELSSTTQSPPRRTPNSRNSPALSENEHFQNIERQFEVMHDQLRTRPMSPASHAPPSRASSRRTTKNPRHVDLLDALFSSHRYQMQSAAVMSPITPYNEDVAERNMAPFLRARGGQSRNAYSRIISALYQEDVADRNIAQNRRRSRSLSRSPSPSRLDTSHSYQLEYQRHGGDVKARPRARTKDSQLVNSISQEALYSVPKSFRDQVVADSTDSTPSTPGLLRTQRSAPTVLSEQSSTSRGGSSRTDTHLGVPPAYKQGESWSNTPLPDSPTLPTITSVQRRPNDSRRQQDSRETSTPSPRLPSMSEVPKRPKYERKASSKKNVLDLSINTELAARGRPKKIVHRAIQPPTPSSHEMKQNPSIAEVMNSPLPVATPTPIPSPLPSSNQKVAEIMDMFRKAYASSQAISPHPTFETLQDAIIREINSHEAFQRVPVPEPGPPFTPSPFQHSFEKGPRARRTSGSISLKDGQLSKLIRKGSFKRHRRDSEARKSISTSIPANISLNAPNRRRHTDAPLPSPGFFETMEQPPSPPKEQLTYMDLILRSEKSNDTKRSKNTSKSNGSRPSSTAAPSVLHMRAQTSPSADDSPNSFSTNDSDSEIIHLPSIPSIPRVQIHGVDENNVTYVAENTSPRNAYRLMNWPRKSSHGQNLRNSFTRNEHQSPSGRSVESY
ncbi:hypothetical protein ASPCAL12064 [Aspergillus calidoustus]|uniref:Uncharacterized protein n=1 Tax=Aspergillus calidoustus TaxID=454130 RepID=A0A0U5GCJ0_ASPCI|nr:hypothetical protein ASPCAL12064 [Aspergillus calidoustus]